MNKIKKLIILGLVVAFASFLVFPAAIFSGTEIVVKKAEITEITPGECGESTIVCIKLQNWGSTNLYAEISVREGGCTLIDGFPKLFGPYGNGTYCLDIGVVPAGAHVVNLDLFEGESTTARTQGNDSKPLVCR